MRRPPCVRRHPRIAPADPSPRSVIPDEDILQAANPPAPPSPKPRVPTKADEPPVPGKEPATLALPPNFLDRIVDAAGKAVSFALPGGRQASGTVELLRRDAQGVLLVQGRLTQPVPGAYTFQRQTAPGVAGSLVGNVRFDAQPIGFRVDPLGPGGSPVLVERRLDQIICNIPGPDPERVAAANLPEYAPQTYPTNIPIPDYQNGVLPLQSLPGATGVIYLDFDGEKGPFSGWGTFDAAPSGANNTQIKEVWQRVAEDYQAFNLNITTDRRVYDSAPRGSRMHVLVTPTNTAAPGAGGVASSAPSTGRAIRFAGRFIPRERRPRKSLLTRSATPLAFRTMGGPRPPRATTAGTAPARRAGRPSWGWAITKTSRSGRKANTRARTTPRTTSRSSSATTTTWTRALRTSAPRWTARLTSKSCQTTRSPTKASLSRARISDSFRFVTSGGAVTLTASVVNAGPNIDLSAECTARADVLIASSNPDTQVNATVTATLAAGEYTLRITGVGRGDPLTDGYSDYGSMGAFLVSGTVAGGVKPDRFTVNENSASGTAVGTVQPRAAHGANPLAYTIASGNPNGAFSIDATTGALTVANAAELNFETLSTRWDDPATIPFFVTIADATDPLLTETVRVVVTVSDVNEAPTLLVAA